MAYEMQQKKWDRSFGNIISFFQSGDLCTRAKGSGIILDGCTRIFVLKKIRVTLKKKKAYIKWDKKNYG